MGIKKYFFKTDFLPFLLVLPIITILTTVILVPTIWAFFFSLQHYELGKEIFFVGFQNYVNILKDGDFWNAFINTFKFVSLTNIFGFFIGLGIAVLLSRGFPLQKIWVSLIIAPYAMSPVVSVVMWKYMLGYNVGAINYLLSFLGVERLQWLVNSNLTFMSMILVDIWRETPFIIIILYSAIVSLPLQLYESAKIDGASAWNSFVYITMPLITPAILVAVIFRFIFSFRTFDIIWVMTKGGPAKYTEVLSIYLYLQGFYYWDFGAASSVASIMLLVTFLVSTYIIRVMYKRMFLGE